jgi:hypothetical protein
VGGRAAQLAGERGIEIKSEKDIEYFKAKNIVIMEK